MSLPGSIPKELDSQSFKLEKGYAYYVLGLLWLVALFRFVDLQIIAVLLNSIRSEFSFSDTQLGLLTGVAFALFYASLGIPIAWLADRRSRVSILSAAIGLWSLMTMLCGLANSFVSLFFARMGVGVGEAGGYPATASLLSDYFPPEKRGVVFSILGTAIPVGVFVGFLVGGVVNELYGWRAAFMLVGVPGVLLAVVLKLTLREPPRGFSENLPRRARLPFKQSVLNLLRKKSYCFIVLGSCLYTLGAYGSGIWIPSFFIRVHGMQSAEVGVWMAMLYGIGGLIGAMTGGLATDYLAKRTKNKSWYMRVCCISLVLILPLATFVYLWPEPYQALRVHFFVTILMHVSLGPVLAMIQGLASPNERSMAQAINVLVTNLIALSLGPLFVGLFSDHFSERYGDLALGYGILIVVLASYSFAAALFYCASRNLNADIRHSSDTHSQPEPNDVAISLAR